LTDQIETSHDRGAVAIDRDDPRTRSLQNRAAVTTRPEGRVDINPAIMGREVFHSFTAKHRDVANGLMIGSHVKASPEEWGNVPTGRNKSSADIPPQQSQVCRLTGPDRSERGRARDDTPQI
jgi:hypothetical protein